MSSQVDKKNPIPRYLQIKEILEQSIRNGRYQPGARLPGERELAQHFEVSQMTVNKAILSLVSAGWLRREVGNGTFVDEALELPNPVSVTIGFAIPLSVSFAEEDFYLSSLLRGLQKELINEPVSLKVIEAPKERLYDTLMESPVDGCIVIDVLEHSLSDVERLAKEGQKLVILGAEGDPLGVPYIDSDNIAGARKATEHLIRLGHRRIAGAFAYLGMSDSRQRLSSFRATLCDHSIELPEDRLLDLGSGEPIQGALRQSILRLLTRSDRPTAILCGGFFVALEMMQLAREAGLRIPEDLSVVGFDDPLAARYLSPPLTTVRQPLEEMGACALNHLCDWLLKGQAPPMRTVLPEAFIVRDSTAEAPPS